MCAEGLAGFGGAFFAAVAPGVDQAAVAVDADDLAVVGAAAAAALAGHELHVFHGEIETGAIEAAAGEDGRTGRAHQVAVVVHDDRAAEQVLEGVDDAGVFADAALEDHRGNDLLSLGDVVDIVGGDGAADAGDDILPRVAHLDLMDQVRLGEDGAARGDHGRVGGLQGVAAHFFHLDPQAARLAGEEGARARGAEGVHGVVDGNAAFHEDDLRILAADFEDRADVRMEGRGAHGVGGDFILDDGGADHGADQAAGASGRPDADDLVRGRVKLLFQEEQEVADGADRVALRPDVFLRQDGIVFIDDDGLGGDGTHVNAEERAAGIQAFTFFLISTMS